MNAYFWMFAFCAFLMTPVTVHAGVHLRKSVRWYLQVKTAGMVVMRRKKKPRREVAKGILTARRKLLWALTQDGSVSRMLRVFTWEELYIHARLSFQDAALTALSYATLHTLLETLERCHALPAKAVGRMEADFRAQGSGIEIHGIFSARMGKIILACIRFAAAMLKTRSKLSTEEEAYAAASH